MYFCPAKIFCCPGEVKERGYESERRDGLGDREREKVGDRETDREEVYSDCAFQDHGPAHTTRGGSEGAREVCLKKGVLCPLLPIHPVGPVCYPVVEFSHS